MEDLVPHPSVLNRLWLYHLELSKQAAELLERVRVREFRLVAPDILELRTLADIVEDLAGSPQPLAPAIATALVGDVRSLHRRLARDRHLELIEHRVLHSAAFAVAIRYGLRVDDAVFVACALANDKPLAVADPAFRRQLVRLQLNEPSIRIFDLGEISA